MQALKHREIPPMLGLHSSDLSRPGKVVTAGGEYRVLVSQPKQFWLFKSVTTSSRNRPDGSKNAKNLWEVMD